MPIEDTVLPRLKQGQYLVEGELARGDVRLDAGGIVSEPNPKPIPTLPLRRVSTIELSICVQMNDESVVIKMDAGVGIASVTTATVLDADAVRVCAAAPESSPIDAERATRTAKKALKSLSFIISPLKREPLRASIPVMAISLQRHEPIRGEAP